MPGAGQGQALKARGSFVKRHRTRAQGLAAGWPKERGLAARAVLSTVNALAIPLASSPVSATRPARLRFQR